MSAGSGAATAGIGDLATRLAGSSDLFAPATPPRPRSVNFVAAHDGFTLADLVAYAAKHNEANGEDNRDGSRRDHLEQRRRGPSRRRRIVRCAAAMPRALLATLLLARGTPMLAMGDELGRSQGGNNNAYAQDNETTWLDWAKADRSLIGVRRPA